MKWHPVVFLAVLVLGCGGDDSDANNVEGALNNANDGTSNSPNNEANNRPNNGANNVERTNEQGCFEAGNCNDDVEAACRRFVDNYDACVELAYQDDPERLAEELEEHEETCDPVAGLFSDRAANTFHCQADAFGAGDCSTQEGLNTVVSQSNGC